MTSPPSVTAVVATYNRRAALPGFLDALLAGGGLHEVVVAVDGSEDGSLAYLEDRAREDARIVPLLVDHQGQFGALDAGAHAASGEVVLFLDDDVRADPEMVACHAGHHAARDDLVVLGYMPPVLPDRPTAAQFATVLYEKEYEDRCRSWEHDPELILHNLWGGNFSLRREAYLAMGYEPLRPPAGAEGIRLYNQDRGFGLECLRHGLTGVFDRRASALHLHERTLEGFLRDSYGQGACRVLLAHLHPDLLDPATGGVPRSRAGAALDRLGARERAGQAAARTTSGAARAAIRLGSLRAALLTARAARAAQIARGAADMSALLGATAPAEAA